jgi:hypothetical protein
MFFLGMDVLRLAYFHIYSGGQTSQPFHVWFQSIFAFRAVCVNSSRLVRSGRLEFATLAASDTLGLNLQGIFESFVLFLTLTFNMICIGRDECPPSKELVIHMNTPWIVESTYTNAIDPSQACYLSNDLSRNTVLFRRTAWSSRALAYNIFIYKI